jgi:predicted ArsR family transcriptional regulator
MAGFAASRADVMALVARRPCSVGDIAAGLGIHRSEALKTVMALVDDGQAEAAHHGAELFFQAAHTVADDATEERS